MDALTPPEPQATGARDAAPPQPDPAAFQTYRAFARLAVGLALIGTEGLTARLRESEGERLPAEVASDESDFEPRAGDILRALIGLGFLAVDSTARVASATAHAAHSTLESIGAPLQPVARSPLFRPLRALAVRGRKRYLGLLRLGLAEEQRTRRLAADVTGLLLEDITDFAGENEGVTALVDAQVERLLPALVADPTIQQLLVEQLGEWLDGLTARSESLDPLVRALGDRYIAYLNEHPDDVQNLVQGQAASMAGEVRDSVRSITVTGDSFLEILARGLLRRPPRDDTQGVNLRRRRAAPLGRQDALVDSGEGRQ